MMICLAFFGVAQAQLSQGDTYSSKIRTGNRPDKGDWGIYLGPSYSELVDFIDWLDKSKDVDALRGLPLINVKYYSSDKLEWRLGFQYYNKVTKYNGIIENEDDSYNERGKDATTLFMLSPGVAYHFSNKNLLDVYVGANVPMGYDGERNIFVSDDVKNNAIRNSFAIGLGAFIGLQSFIADLPLSIGFEYGIEGLLKCGQKVKNITTDIDGNEQIYFTNLNDEDLLSPTQYSRLSSRTKTFGSDFRLTITYYFNNKK